MEHMENTKHDATSYGSCGYQREITLLTDGNALYEAYKRSMRGTSWKNEVQRFEMNHLLELSMLQRELSERTYTPQPTKDFIIRERGKTRLIQGEHFRDRVVKHVLCDSVLMPRMKNKLIYDNGASVEGKGVSFTRKRLDVHLRKFYQKHGNNGYILLIDFSKYYDNIRHDVLMEIFKKHITDEDALWLIKVILEREKVDVSYLSDDEYEGCINQVFDSLIHAKLDRSLFTGKRYMRKHLCIGDQLSQVAGIAYPMVVDNYVKTVLGMRLYARYMDDCYIIHESKEELEKALCEIKLIAKSIGIEINDRKTKIIRLSEYFEFLKIKYSLGKTGRIIKKINKKRLISFQRKAKKLSVMIPKGELMKWYRSWFGSHYKIMSEKQRTSACKLLSLITGKTRKGKHYARNHFIRRHKIRKS